MSGPKGGGLVVVEESHDMMNSLNLAFDALEKKLKKEREKFREKKRRGGRERKEFGLPAASEPAEAEKRVIRSRYTAAKPMTLEEAALELELKKKEVFVFRMEGTEKWAVLFRRKDGHYGLVEPE